MIYCSLQNRQPLYGHLFRQSFIFKRMSNISLCVSFLHSFIYYFYKVYHYSRYFFILSMTKHYQSFFLLLLILSLS